MCMYGYIYMYIRNSHIHMPLIVDEKYKGPCTYRYRGNQCFVVGYEVKVI